MALKAIPKYSPGWVGGWMNGWVERPFQGLLTAMKIKVSYKGYRLGRLKENKKAKKLEREKS